MKTKKRQLDSVSVDIYQYANGTLIHRYFHLMNGNSYTSDKFFPEGLNKLMLSINPIKLDAKITSFTIYDHSNINYIDSKF